MKYSWFLLAFFLLFLACSDKKDREREREAERQRIEAKFNEFRADSLQNYLVSLYRDPQIRARMNANEDLLPNWRLLKEPGHKQSKVSSSRARIRADKLQDHIDMLYADPVIQRRMGNRQYLILDRKGFLLPPKGHLDTLYPDPGSISLLPIPQSWLDGKADIPTSDQTATTPFKLDFGSIIFWEAFEDSLRAISELKDIRVSEEDELVQVSFEGNDLFLPQSDSMSDEGSLLLTDFYRLLTRFPDIHEKYSFSLIRDTTSSMSFALSSLMRQRSKRLQLAFQNRGILDDNVTLSTRVFPNEVNVSERKMIALIQRFTVRIEAE
ncbi:MAG: hypothetical protein AAGC85_06215 [Bacteroidota bacterium]